MKTGVGVRDAFKALKALDLDPGTLAKLNNTINAYEDLYTACRANGFPGTTQVLMADGSRRPVSQVGVGDLVKATDPATGQMRTRQVIGSFKRLRPLGDRAARPLGPDPAYGLRPHRRRPAHALCAGGADAGTRSQQQRMYELGLQQR
ncbi:hypothetical protein [Streptomyces sp. NPDC001388]|uniref:hypothetical protein n=1 Tax=Streptomyces sp. NPDC001388 TaxID=3364568 RepID=UPI0036AAB1CF